MITRTADAGRGFLGEATLSPTRWIAEIGQAWARYQEYLQTLADLRGMSDRDLADIGISRHSIREIAREAAYGN